MGQSGAFHPPQRIVDQGRHVRRGRRCQLARQLGGDVARQRAGTHGVDVFRQAGRPQQADGADQAQVGLQGQRSQAASSSGVWSKGMRAVSHDRAPRPRGQGPERHPSRYTVLSRKLLEIKRLMNYDDGIPNPTLLLPARASVVAGSAAFHGFAQYPSLSQSAFATSRPSRWRKWTTVSAAWSATWPIPCTTRRASAWPPPRSMRTSASWSSTCPKKATRCRS